MTASPPPAFSDPRTIAGHRRVYELTAEETERAHAVATEIAGSREPVSSLTTALHDRIRPAYGLAGYRRRPLEIYADGKGDCFETSAVAALLLRSLDIPCRFVTELCAARFEPGAALALLVPTAVAGPFTNSHVWLEAWTNGGWEPLDVQFGVYGRKDWEARRLKPRGGRFGFRFPLQLKSLDAGGFPDDELAEPYLLAPFENLRGSDAFKRWDADVDYFRGIRRGNPFLGARLTFMLPRLRRMERNLETLLASR